MNKRSKNIMIFLVIAFLVPLLSISIQSIVHNTTLTLILYGIEAASPTIAAIVMLRKEKRFTAFVKRMFHRDTFVLAILLPIIIACLTMLLAKLFYCLILNIEFTGGSISSSQFIIISWALIAEEWGWRGYLEPSLIKNGIKKWQAPCIVGIIWCVWHYHFFLRDGMEIPILLFLISCIVESYIYSWLMEYTNSNLSSAMIYHFSWNLFIHVFAINPSDNNGNIVPYVILVILEIVVLLLFNLSSKKRSISN